MAYETSLIRTGIVSDVDTVKLHVRVYYPSLNNLVSDWLPVLQQPVYVGSTGSGGSPSHTHGIASYIWLPKVNDKVLVIMEYGFNSGGYVAGVIP